MQVGEKVAGEERKCGGQPKKENKNKRRGSKVSRFSLVAQEEKDRSEVKGQRERCR